MLIEKVLLKENLLTAHKKVISNKGGPGVDGMKVEELWEFCKHQWQGIRKQITDGKYTPYPVKQVEIPKTGGGIRKLGIPCVIDRLILQSINQILVSIFDKEFSESSYGFRPGKSAHDAVKKSGEYIAKGHKWVVSIDLEKFFDRVNHDILMAKIAKKVKDKTLLALIRKYLQAGIMNNGIIEQSLEGTIQGAPLSPLLSNIMLDALDKELEKRGHNFSRFADDANIYVKSERAGQRVMESIKKYLWEELKLPVNKEKSKVVVTRQHTFLGYQYYRYKNPRLRIAPKSIKRLKDKIRSKLKRWRGNELKVAIRELNQMIQGWIVYFRLGEGKVHLTKLETWIQRHLRKIQWRQWKTSRTRFNKLMSLGVNRRKAAKAAWGRGGAWYSSSTSAMNFALDSTYLRKLNWLGIINIYNKYKINVSFI